MKWDTGQRIMGGADREGLFKTGSWVMKLADPEKSCPDRTGDIVEGREGGRCGLSA